MTRYALIAALCASLAAAGLFWAWKGAREDNARLRASLAAADAVIEVLNDYAVTVRDIEDTLSDRLGDLANVPDTSTCGPAVGRALDLLRAE